MDEHTPRRWGGGLCRVVCVLGHRRQCMELEFYLWNSRRIFADWKDSQLILRSPSGDKKKTKGFNFGWRVPLKHHSHSTSQQRIHFRNISTSCYGWNYWKIIIIKKKCLKEATDATNVAEGPHLNWNLNSSCSHNRTDPPSPWGVLGGLNSSKSKRPQIRWGIWLVDFESTNSTCFYLSPLFLKLREGKNPFPRRTPGNHRERDHRIPWISKPFPTAFDFKYLMGSI